MMKLQIGLGLLSLPQSFHNVGMIPAVILLVVVASITGYSSWTVGMFKLRHPEVYGIDDAGNIMFGRIGRELLGTFFCLCEFFFSIFPSWCGGGGSGGKILPSTQLLRYVDASSG